MSANTLPEHIQMQLASLTAADKKRLAGIIDDVSRCVEETAAFIRAGKIDYEEMGKLWLPAIKRLRTFLKQMEALVEVPTVLHSIEAAGPEGTGSGLRPEDWREYVEQRTKLARQELETLKTALGDLTSDGDGATDEAVVWFHGEKSYSTDGKSPVTVSREQHNILQAFLNKDIAIDTPTLGKSGVNNVSAVITKLRERFGEKAVPRPKRKGDGYRIIVRSLRKTK